jgi:uncharacterized protein DUF4365
MSKRPRSHRIEDESRIAFERLLPEYWVYRPVRPDYGVDGCVEIFDQSGQSTGMQFNVQLKATDDQDLKKALAVRLNIDTCEYYRSLDLPTLIIRFHAPTGRVFAKWFHAFDPYYAKKGKKTVTFGFATSDEWSDDTTEKLSLHLKMVRCVRSGNLPLPVPFSLNFSADLVQGLSIAEVSLNLRKAIVEVQSILRISGDSTSVYGMIAVSDKDIVVNLAGIKSLTLHLRQSYGPDFARKVLHHDILIATALTLDSAGYPAAAANLIAKFAGQSGLISSPEIAMMMAGCLARAHRLAEALKLAEQLLTNRTSRLPAYVLMVSALTKTASMSDDERELLRHFLTRYVEEEEKTGDSLAAATANYNLANHLRFFSQPRSAFRRYRRAAKWDPKYLERGYFYRELAGVLFSMERYRMAAKLYDCGLQRGEKGSTRALFADTLMFCGDYSDALREFETYISAEQAPKSGFVLKWWALKERMLKCARQDRKPSFYR